MDIIAIFILVGVIQGLIISLVLLRNHNGSKIANQLLALFCFLFALVTFEDFLMRTKFILQIPHIWGLLAPFTFLLGPIFYLYVESLSKPKFVWKKTHLIHSIPFLLIVSILFFNVYIQPANIKKQWILESINTHSDAGFWDIAFVSQPLIYLLLSLRLIKIHQTNIKKFFAYDEQINLKWLKILILSVIAIWAIWCSSVAFNSLYFENLDAVSFPVFVYLLGYWGISQRNIYPQYVPLLQPVIPSEEQHSLIEESNLIPTEERAKYRHSNLSEEDIDTKLKFIQHLMKTEKPYLKGELTIQDFSMLVNVPVNQLSQIINSRLNQNFFEFVNSYRVEEFKQQVLSSEKQHLSLLGIALECGFNSKASFNLVFKKYCGITPSAYKKQAERMHQDVQT